MRYPLHFFYSLIVNSHKKNHDGSKTPNLPGGRQGESLQ